MRIGDRDPAGQLEFQPELTEYMLLDVTAQYQVVTGTATPHLWAYRCWFTARHQDLMVPVQFKDRFGQLASFVDTMDRAAFLESALVALARMDAKALGA